ncbi:MAG: hypothetical protein AABY15_05755 [Nanoarchaeota archaeon]
MADNFDDRIKKVKAYQDALDSVNKKLAAQESAVKGLADITGVAYAGFINQVEKTNAKRREEAKLINDAKKAIQEQTKEIGNLVDKAFGISDALKKSVDQSSVFKKSLKDLRFDDIYKNLDSIVDVEEKMNKLIEEHGKDTAKQLDEFKDLKKLKEEYNKNEKEAMKVTKDNLEDFLDKNTDILALLGEMPINLNDAAEVQKALNGLLSGEKEIIDQIITSESASTDLKESLVGLDDRRIESQTNLNKLVKEQSNEMVNQTSIAKNLWSFIEKNSKNAFTAISKGIMDNNQAFKDGQKDFGLMFEGNYQQMADLTSKAAEFNMSTKDTVQMMGQLGDELKTTDTQYLASATEHFVAVQKATGIASEDVTTIAGEMMRAGNSAEDVEKFMEGTNKMAKLFNVNSKKVLQSVARNIDKMRTMGFTGGEESLARMAAEAERLKINVDGIFDVAKRARTIEGAMDMAAELQLAGGSFAAINPMDLLSAARKGPKELQDILKGMGKDIGHWNEETGEFQFDPIDADRLQIVADATGMTLDDITKMIQSNAEDSKKAEFMPDLQLGEVMGPDGKPLDQDMMNNMLKDSVDVHGEILEGSMLDKAGVKDIKDLTSEQAESIIKDHMNKQATLEEQAKQNQSFQDSITAFKDAVMNMFTVFQPIIDILTGFMQALIEMGPVGKFLGAAIIGFIAIAPLLGKAMIGLQAMKGGAGWLKDKIMGGAPAAAKGQDAIQKNAQAATDSGGKTGGAKGSQGGLQSLAQGLKAMGGKGVLKGIGNTALAGPALLLLLPGMPTLLLMAGVGALSALVIAGFNALAQGFSVMGNAKGLIKGALAMVLVGASLIPFAFAMSMMTDISWEAVLAGLTFMLAAVGIVALLGLIMMSGVGAVAILAGAAAMLIVSAAFLVFAIALQQLVPAAEGLSQVGFGWMIDLGLAMALAGPLLLLGGIMLGIAAPFILMGALALYPIVDLAERVNEVNWDNFAKMGAALLAVVPGLLAFSAAGMLGGMMSFIGGLFGGGGPLDTLETLADIAITAADPLMIMSDAIDGLADGIEKLEAAAAALDVEKLEMLRSLAWSMAIGSFGGGLMGDQINKIAEALAKLAKIGEGGGGGGTKKIQIDLKLNGRDMQSVIVDDTSIVS